jgi:hypothetical protein
MSILPPSRCSAAPLLQQAVYPPLCVCGGVCGGVRGGVYTALCVLTNGFWSQAVEQDDPSILEAATARNNQMWPVFIIANLNRLNSYGPHRLHPTPRLHAFLHV